MKKLNIVSVKLPKKQLEKAVEAIQLYHGSTDCRMNDQQKLYDRAKALIKALADKLNMDSFDVWDQVKKEADKRGKITPIPGRHI